MSRRAETIGLLLAGYSAANGAFGPAFAKLTTGLGSSLLVATMTSAFAALGAVAVLAARGKLAGLVARETRWPLMAIGVLGTAVALGLMYAGAARASATELAVCLQVEPLYALLFSRIVLGHPITPARGLAVFAILGGIALALGAKTIDLSLGVVLLLATPIAWQASHMIALRFLREFDPAQVTGARYTYGTLALVLFWLVSEGPSTFPTGAELPRFLGLLAIQGLVLAFLGTFSWYGALARLDVTRTTALTVPVSPLLSLLVSFLLLGEVASAREIAGMLLTAAGVLAFALAPDVDRSYTRADA